jgi:hypothetical protein
MMCCDGNDDIFASGEFINLSSYANTPNAHHTRLFRISDDII